MERDDDEPEQVCKRARIAEVAEDLNVCEEAAQLLHLVEQSKSTGPKVASPASRKYMKYLVKEMKLQEDWPFSKMMGIFGSQDSTSAAIDEILDDMKGTLKLRFSMRLWTVLFFHSADCCRVVQASCAILRLMYVRSRSCSVASNTPNVPDDTCCVCVQSILRRAGRWITLSSLVFLASILKK